MVVITPLCNSGMHVLVGFSAKTSAARQIFHHVASFGQVAVLRFSDTNDICWVCWVRKSRTGKVTNWPGKLNEDAVEATFSLYEGKKSTGSVAKDCVVLCSLCDYIFT